MAIQLIQNGVTTCIDNSYNINYNGTALEEIWFCDTSNATCTQVWKKKLGLTITGSVRTVGIFPDQDSMVVGYVNSGIPHEGWTCNACGTATNTTTIGTVSAQLCSDNNCVYYLSSSNGIYQEVVYGCALVCFNQPLATFTNTSNCPITVETCLSDRTSCFGLLYYNIVDTDSGQILPQTCTRVFGDAGTSCIVVPPNQICTLDSVFLETRFNFLDRTHCLDCGWSYGFCYCVCKYNFAVCGDNYYVKFTVKDCNGNEVWKNFGTGCSCVLMCHVGNYDI